MSTMSVHEKTAIEMKIVERAYNLGVIDMEKISPKFTLLLDIDHTIPESHLQKLLNSDESDFSHDIVGIQSHWNRKLMVMEECFIPRCLEN